MLQEVWTDHCTVSVSCDCEVWLSIVVTRYKPLLRALPILSLLPFKKKKTTDATRPFWIYKLNVAIKFHYKIYWHFIFLYFDCTCFLLLRPLRNTCIWTSSVHYSLRKHVKAIFYLVYRRTTTHKQEPLYSLTIFKIKLVKLQTFNQVTSSGGFKRCYMWVS